MLGEYVLEEKLGAGGSAEVFAARKGDTRVALKVLRPHLAVDPEVVRLFEQEALIARALIHPNIVRVLEVCEADEQHFLVLEYVDGRSLSGKRPLREALRIADALLDALAFAHSRDIVHRDLSPANVLLGRDGAVKLTDFGSAKINHYRQRTRTGELKGHFSYMSPEHAAGHPVDGRSDIFSVALLLREMLTGQAVYSQEEVRGLEQAREAAIPPLHTGNRALDRALTRGLAKNPRDRFQTAEEFRAALRKARPLPRWTLAVPVLLAAAFWLTTRTAGDPPAPVAEPTASAEAPPQPSPDAAQPRRGFLSVNARPWARVYIDGELVKSETPLQHHPLGEGKHTLTLVRGIDGKKRVIQVDIHAGKTTTEAVDWK